MTTEIGRRGTLIKGIAHTMGRSHGTVGIAKSQSLPELEQIANDPDVIKGVREDAKAMHDEIIKVLSDSGSEDPVGQADAIIAAVQSGQSVRNFLSGADNASPGQRPGIISAGGKPRTRGWTDQNQVARSDNAFVSGGEDEKTPDSYGAGYRNPESGRDGYAYEAGHEQYGLTGIGGSGEDVSPGRAGTTRSPRDDRNRTFGHTNPPNPTFNPGRSGNYGAPAKITTSTTTPRVETHKTISESARRFQKDAGFNPELAGTFDRLYNRTRSDRRPAPLTKEQIQREADFEVRREEGEFSKLDDEELSRIRRLIEEEEEYRRLAREDEDEETRFDYEAKANASAQLRKQLVTKLSLETGLSALTLTKSVGRGRFYPLKLEK